MFDAGVGVVGGAYGGKLRRRGSTATQFGVVVEVEIEVEGFGSAAVGEEWRDFGACGCAQGLNFGGRVESGNNCGG